MSIGWRLTLMSLLCGVNLLIFTACLPVGNEGVKLVNTAIPSEEIFPISSSLSPGTPENIESADVFVLTVKQINQVTELAVGQLVNVIPPDTERQWHIDFSPNILEPLDPASAAGWSFLTLAPGEGQITLTSAATCEQPPCPIMPIRFVFCLTIK